MAGERDSPGPSQRGGACDRERGLERAVARRRFESRRARQLIARAAGEPPGTHGQSQPITRLRPLRVLRGRHQRRGRPDGSRAAALLVPTLDGRGRGSVAGVRRSPADGGDLRTRSGWDRHGPVARDPRDGSDQGRRCRRAGGAGSRRDDRLPRAGTPHWNRTDASGRSVPAGIHFAITANHDEHARCRMVVLRWRWRRPRVPGRVACESMARAHSVCTCQFCVVTHT